MTNTLKRRSVLVASAAALVGVSVEESQAKTSKAKDPDLDSVLERLLDQKERGEEALDGNGQIDNKPEDTAPAQPQQPTNKRGRKKKERSEERRVGKECRSRWSPYH